MKRATFAVALIALFALGAPLAYAYTSPGAPQGYVNDFAHVLDAAAAQTLETELTQFEKETSNEITVVTVTSLGGDYIENYAVKLFEEWGIGKKDKDNGVLLLLAMEEHEMRIEVGYGLEGALPDSVAQSILNNEMAPRLKAGDYDGAVNAGVTAIEQATKGEYAAEAPSSDRGFDPVASKGALIVWVAIMLFQFLIAILARSKSWWAGGIVGAAAGIGLGWYFSLALVTEILVTLILIALGLGFDYMVSKGFRNAMLRGTTPPWWAGGAGRSGSSSGGGFGGFGGGSSGGGGASGRW